MLNFVFFFKKFYYILAGVWRRCSIRVYLHWGLMSYLRYLCFLVYSGVQHILCCIFVLFYFVLCTPYCQFLWIVHFWLPLRYSCKLDIYGFIAWSRIFIFITWYTGTLICVVGGIYHYNMIHRYIWCQSDWNQISQRRWHFSLSSSLRLKCHILVNQWKWRVSMQIYIKYDNHI
jgi:hypothetical protein